MTDADRPGFARARIGICCKIGAEGSFAVAAQGKGYFLCPTNRLWQKPYLSDVCSCKEFLKLSATADRHGRVRLAIRARKTLTPRFTDSFTDCEKKKPSVLQSITTLAFCESQEFILSYNVAHPYIIGRTGGLLLRSELISSVFIQIQIILRMDRHLLVIPVKDVMT